MIMSGYGRVSTDEERQLDSLAHQKEFFAEFAESYHHVLFKVYADEGISGKQLKKRDEFNAMMRDAALGFFELVVVKDVSRFARNTVDLLTSVRKLKALGIEILFLGNNQKILGESEFVLTILGAVAQEESANLSRRVKFGKKINAKKGRVPPRIFGYDRIDNFTLEINDSEAETVREIYRLYLEDGFGCRKIALALDENNALTKFGMQWNPRGVRRVLSNPIYCGHYFNHKYEITDFLEGTQKRLPPEEYFEHDRPEWIIVAPEQFAEAKRVMDARRKIYEGKYTHRAGRYSGRHLFSTLIRCAHCERAFSRHSYTYVNTRVYWKCTTNDQQTSAKCDNNITIDEDLLKQQICNYLSDLLQDKKIFAEKILNKYNADNATNGKNLTHQNIELLQTKRARLEKQKEKYQEMYANDIISMDDLKKKLAAVSEQLLKVTAALSRAITAQAEVKTETAAIEIAFSEIERFLTLESMTNADLKKLISAITVDRDGIVKINLKIDENCAVRGNFDLPIWGQW